MKFKENFKRFMTLDRHHDGGFTLVELIVVIAILAILAGIGVPAYSSYIGKANLAADQQVIDIVNTCFAAAAADSWMSVAELEGSTLTISNGEITGLVANNAGDKKADIEAAFLTYFKGGSLKTVSSVASSGPRGFSIGGTAGGTGSNIDYAGIFAGLGTTISGSVTNLQNSTFGTIGAEQLMDKVGTVTGLAADLAGLNSTFQNALTENMGDLIMMMLTDEEKAAIANGTMTEEELAALSTSKINELIYQVNPNAVDKDGNILDANLYNEASNQIAANYAVLAAAKATTKTADELLKDLQGGIDSEDIKNLLSGNSDKGSTQDGLSQAAMMYAMYTAYANQLDENSPHKETAMNATQSHTEFLKHMNDEDFVNYLKGEGNYEVNENETTQAMTDLQGYLGALDIINQSASSDPDAVLGLVVNGYTDPTLVQALQGLLGTQN